MGIDLDGDPLARAHPARDDAFATQATCGTDHGSHRTEQVDERGDVVRPHVEQRPAPLAVGEVGIRVPALDSSDRLALQLALSDGRSRDYHDEARIAQLLHSVATDLSVACTLVL
ncbi:hypothetical protein [Agromyces sp. Soil535]|uniref:hypothetical protein n=1 Tax=Agromyces sp. Soil535 TaxID=1736390 RepID=UPI0019108563|nr:hypothetical protein [Agromyces sp. Soil535]